MSSNEKVHTIEGKLIDQGSPKELMYDDNWYQRMLENDGGV